MTEKTRDDHLRQAKVRPHHTMGVTAMVRARTQLAKSYALKEALCEAKLRVDVTTSHGLVVEVGGDDAANVGRMS